jgi:hypothetical protein
MRTARSIVASLTVFALLLWIAPSPALASGDGARLEGLLVGVDGRPASDMTVHLIDGQGNDVAQVGVSDEGLYSFQQLPPGEYSLGIENTEGQMAPVMAPAVNLSGDQLARRDLKLMQADPGAMPGTMTSGITPNYGMGTWWAGLSTAAKAWTIVAIVAVVGITAAALSSDDDDSSEPPSSAYLPPGE